MPEPSSFQPVQQSRARSACPLQLHTDLDRTPRAYAHATARAAPRLASAIPATAPAPDRPRTTASRTASRAHIACVLPLCSLRSFATACMNPPRWQDRRRGAAMPSGPPPRNLLHVHALLTLRLPAMLECAAPHRHLHLRSRAACCSSCPRLRCVVRCPPGFPEFPEFPPKFTAAAAAGVTVKSGRACRLAHVAATPVGAHRGYTVCAALLADMST